VALPSEDSEEVVVLMDEDSELINSIEGDALFDDDGNESELLKTKAKAVVSFIEEANLTRAFLKMLVEMDLITKQDLTVNLGENATQQINGIYLVDEKKLNELSDEAFSKLRKNGGLPAIYAHLLSIRQINRIIRKKLEADA
jgi:hypothetical protein